MGSEMCIRDSIFALSVACALGRSTDAIDAYAVFAVGVHAAATALDALTIGADFSVFTVGVGDTFTGFTDPDLDLSRPLIVAEVVDENVVDPRLEEIEVEARVQTFAAVVITSDLCLRLVTAGADVQNRVTRDGIEGLDEDAGRISQLEPHDGLSTRASTGAFVAGRCRAIVHLEHAPAHRRVDHLGILAGRRFLADGVSTDRPVGTIVVVPTTRENTLTRVQITALVGVAVVVIVALVGLSDATAIDALLPREAIGVSLTERWDALATPARETR